MAITPTGLDYLDIAIQSAVALLYGWVGYVITNRSVSDSARLPNQSFAMWWIGLAVLTWFGVLREIRLWFVEPSMPLYMAYLHFVLLLIMVAFAGMMYYFLYLWSGKVNLWVPVTSFYLALYIFFVYYIELQQPSGFDAEGTLEYARDLSDTGLARAVGILFLLPPIIGAALYLSLLRRVKEPLLRFRIALVATSIIVWFTISIGASIGGASDNDAWAYISRVISASVALLVFIAYKPPKRVRQWLGNGYADTAAPPPE